MGNRAAIASFFALLLCWSPVGAQANELDTSGIPAPLLPWVDWVVEESPRAYLCADVAGARTCEWPGELTVRALGDGATFELRGFTDVEAELSLPGSAEQWPLDVRVDGRSGVVVEVSRLGSGSEDTGPAVRVSPGEHRITGRFRWASMPDVLPVPPTVAQIALAIGGTDVVAPRVDSEGRLWLRDEGTTSEEGEADSVRASVYRRFTDGVPMLVTTRVRLNVAGRAREVKLGQVLLPNSRPTAVRAPLPVRVAPDGEVSAYVRPGTWDLEVDAVLPNAPESLKMRPAGPDFYDPQEVWIWVPDEELRSVQLGGLTSVDPERTSLADDWKGYTTFLAEPSDELKLTVLRRGITESAPNALSLDREIWLDVDGRGYTVRDRITGSMQRGWRLDHSGADGGVLGRVANNGENLLITEVEGKRGVELRQSLVELTAEIRLPEPTDRISIVGWDHDIQSLSATLNLPPGWTLLYGEGVDSIEGTWVDSWTLWDFLFVLVVALAIGRLFGWPWMIVALFALVLSHGESGAPAWIWLFLIVTLALARALPNSRWRKLVVAMRGVGLVILAIIVAPFVHDQILGALHPQVGGPNNHYSASSFDDLVQMEMDQEFAMEEAAPAAPASARIALGKLDDSLASIDLERGSGYGGGKKSGSSVQRKEALQQVDPHAIVQTGPGLPVWSWSSWNLRWTGPVRKDHTVKLWLVQPAWNSVLAFLRILLVLLIALLLLAPRDMYWNVRAAPPQWWRRIFGTGAILLATGGLGTTWSPTPAHAQVPAPEMLQELRQRLARQTACEAPCVVVHDAALSGDGLDVTFTASVSATTDTAMTLPGPMDAFKVESVTVDRRPTQALRREASGLTRLRLDEGTHDVVVRGRLAERNSLALQFENSSRPRQMRVDLGGWAVDGISPRGVPDGSIQLTRTGQTTTDGGMEESAVELPPWYRVQRTVALGLPWQIDTRVERDDASRAQLVRVPIPGGTKVITDGVRVEGDVALIDFARGETEKEFTVELPIEPQVKLVAPTGQPWTETWRVACSRIWRCKFSELPPTSLTDGTGAWRPIWQPWPGEELTIDVERPEGASGEPKTIDRVTYTVTPGKRLLEAGLDLHARASQGGWQEITLPPDSDLLSVVVNGTTRSIRARDRVVKLPIQPGENHVALAWQQPWERNVTERVPEIDIGSEAANAEILMNPGEERLLLAVRNDGVRWGPAVLFWPHLAMLFILALLLGTMRNVPLGWPEWLLLAIGMSQLPVPAMIPVVLWFVALSLRRRRPPQHWLQFDATQLLLVGLTLAAGVSLYAAVHTNLLIDIDMQVEGAQSTDRMLRWYVERVSSTLPAPAIVSVPAIWYRIAMLLWSLWLGWKLLSWSKWGWEAFSTAGRWRSSKPTGTSAPETDGEPNGRGTHGDDHDGRDEEVTPDIPQPVPRHAEDGRLVRTEYELGAHQIVDERDEDEDELGEEENLTAEPTDEDPPEADAVSDVEATDDDVAAHADPDTQSEASGPIDDDPIDDGEMDEASGELEKPRRKDDEDGATDEEE